MGCGLADNEVSVVGREVERSVGSEKGFLMHAARLAFIECDEHGDGWIECLLHEDIVQLGVVETEHVEVERDGDAREDVLQDVVNIIAADVEEMNVFAGVGGVGGLFCVLREIRQRECLEAFGGIAEHVARALLGRLRIGLLNGSYDC